jgi:hypothetical protein
MGQNSWGVRVLLSYEQLFHRKMGKLYSNSLRVLWLALGRKNSHFCSPYWGRGILVCVACLRGRMRVRDGRPEERSKRKFASELSF